MLMPADGGGRLWGRQRCWYTCTVVRRARQSGSAAERSPDVAPLAREWARAVTHALYRPMSRPEMEGLLQDLLRRLHGALIADPFTAEPARSAGAALVAAGIQRPEALERSLVFLDEHLLAGLGLEDYAYRPAMTRLLAGLAGGWAGLLRENATRERRGQRKATGSHDARPLREARRRA